VAGLIRALGEPWAHVVGHGWGGMVGWTVTALHPRLVRSLAVLGAPHPLAVRRAVLRDPRGQGRASARWVAGFQLPRLPEHSLRTAGSGVERILRAWSGPEWTATADFAEAAEHYLTGVRVVGVGHCSLEYFRWAVRSQIRAEGRRFAAAVARPAAVPVLQLHGAVDPWLLPATAAAPAPWAGPGHRRLLLPGVGHFPHEESPVLVNQLLLEHLTG
jgi:pimeloyl-ACP methyl ester carboxylesterase